ncbi:MAG: hypothetical protein WKG01_41815, partial [Kofleriaceae bacterium]
RPGCEPTPSVAGRAQAHGAGPAISARLQRTEAPAYWHRVRITVRGPMYRHARVTNEPRPAE